MSVPSGPFANISEVGGPGGSPFVSVGWQQGIMALVVIGLDVYYNDMRLRGIGLTYSDNSHSIVYGSPSDNHGSIAFQAGELVETMTLWGDGIGTRTGRIRLTTNKNQTFDVGKDTTGQTGYETDVGSGILVGMLGRSGLDVDSLGAIFLEPAVTQITITDLVYNPDLSGSTSGISEVALGEQQYSNPANSTSVTTWDFSGGTTRTVTMSYSQTTGDSYGASVSVEVSGEVFGIGAKATGGFQWQSSSEETTSTDVTTAINFSWSLSGQLQPGKSITCTAVVHEGDGKTMYNSTVTVTLADGTTNTYYEIGQLQTIAYTQVSITTS